MTTTRRALFATLLGAGTMALGAAAGSTAGTDTTIANRRPVICGWPTDMARATMPCVLAPHHHGSCLPARTPKEPNNV